MSASGKAKSYCSTMSGVYKTTHGFGELGNHFLPLTVFMPAPGPLPGLLTSPPYSGQN